VESSAEEIGALYESVAFLNYFKDLPDVRQSGKVKYPLDEILLLCLLAMVAGAETITDIARFGRLKLALLRRFRPFEDGTPAHDHLGDILATLDTEAFERCFVAWVAAQTGVPAEVVAIDGKTARRTHDRRKGLKALHTLSAYATSARLILAQLSVPETTNEITAIPDLLDELAEAKQLVAAGQGDVPRRFPDMAQGIPLTATATPLVYLSMFDPDGPAVKASLHATAETWFELPEASVTVLRGTLGKSGK